MPKLTEYAWRVPYIGMRGLVDIPYNRMVRYLKSFTTPLTSARIISLHLAVTALS